jgi:hypothetical protein
MKIEIECFMSLPWLFEMRLEKLLLVRERERERERERIAFHFGGLELGSHGVCGAESGVVVLCKGGRLAFF